MAPSQLHFTDNLLIIPDIHNNFLIAEKIIKKENLAKIIFLGDYFDDFDDTIQDAINTAKWLVTPLKQENRIHLIGNNDLSYMTDNPNLKCIGYTTDKHNAIKKQSIDWNKLLMHYWIDEKWLYALMQDFLRKMENQNMSSGISMDDKLSPIYDQINEIHKKLGMFPSKNFYEDTTSTKVDLEKTK